MGAGAWLGALSVALVSLAYYRSGNADISRATRHTINQVLAGQGPGGLTPDGSEPRIRALPC